MFSIEPFGFDSRTGRATRIAITHHDLSVGVEFTQYVGVGKITAFAMGNRHSQIVPCGQPCVNAESGTSICSRTMSQTNRNPRLRTSVPGNDPASHNT